MRATRPLPPGAGTCTRLADTRRTTALACAAFLVSAGSTPLEGQPAAWAVDSASVTFEIRNAGFPVHGYFEDLDAELCFDPDAPDTGRIDARIDPATIRTGIALRDRHLRRREYFHVERFGAIQMRSLEMRAEGTGFVGTFLLRIRDVERRIDVPFEFASIPSETSDGSAPARATFSGSLTIDRLDYDLGKRSIILADAVAVRVVLEVRGNGPCDQQAADSHPR